MVKCKECKSDDWEFVWNTGIEEEGNKICLYQCKKCKRVVSGGQYDFDEYEGEL